MRFRVILLAGALLCTLNRADAVTMIFVEAPHDEESVRNGVLDLPESKETAGLLLLMERLSIANRSKKMGYNFPWSYAEASKDQLDKRLGKPVEWKAEGYAQPSAGSSIVFAQMPSGERSQGDYVFYELKDVGGVMVFLTDKNTVISPVIVYLKTDAEFVPLKQKSDLAKRLAWEAPKLRELKRWLAIPEDIVKNEDGEVIVVLDSVISRKNRVDNEQSDPRVRVIHDYGLMGAMEP